MKLILCSKFMANVSWQKLVDSIPCLLWGVIVLVALWLLLKYVVKPRCQYCNDAKVRKEKFEREKFWSFYNKIQLVSDEQLNKQIGALNKQIDELEKEKSKLNKDKSEKESLLNKELEIYNTILNRLNIMNRVDNIENKQ